jgi:uncharacterized protein YjbI with pentapeptide repeats
MSAQATEFSRNDTEVKAEEILTHIENGDDIDLYNCTIDGELNVSTINLKIVPNPLFDEFLEQGYTEDRIFSDVGLLDKLSVIESNITIIESTFIDDVYFSFVQFNDSADFHNVNFNNLARFSGTTFNDSADFSGANFNDSADFHNVNFNNLARFSGTTFNDSADFPGTNFYNDADFQFTTFNGFADWFRCKKS